MSTITPTGVSYVSSYSNGNLVLAGVAATQGLFQASSVANEITFMSAKVSGQALIDSLLVIGPTNLANPSGSNGAQFYGPNLSATVNGTVVSLPSVNNTMYSFGVASWFTNGSSYSILTIDNMLIQPGYYVYFYNTAGTSVLAYNVQQVTVKQS